MMKAAVPSPRPNDVAPEAAATAPHVDAAIITFPAGIPGFEACRRFVLVTAPEIAPFAHLNALDPPAASFLTIDPRLIDPAYDLTLRDFERARLNAGAEPLLWLAIVNLGPDGATANLRAPVVINPGRLIGCQFIRDDHDYPVRFPFGG